LDPAIDRRMVDRNAAFRQHFLKVAIADRIATIPAHRPQDHITLEMAPLEIRHRSVRPISAKHAQASRFLQQSPPERRRFEAPALLSASALRIELACLPACTGKRHGFMGFVSPTITSAVLPVGARPMTYFPWQHYQPTRMPLPIGSCRALRQRPLRA